MLVLIAYTLLLAEIFAWKTLSWNFLNTETFDTAYLCLKNKKVCSFFSVNSGFFVGDILSWGFFVTGFRLRTFVPIATAHL